MSNSLKISREDIIYYLKMVFQIPSILEAITTHRIIAQAAEKAGIKVSIEELQTAADNLRLANRLFKAEDTWNWLEKHHLSLDDLEEIAKINLTSSKLANHLFADQIEPFFYAHQLKYFGAVTYEVILDDEDLALELFYALQEGEISFQEIARQYIQNPEVRRAGGYQGIRRRIDFRPEIAAAVFAANPPQIIKPIITPKGVHIIAVEEIIKPELDENLRLQIMGEFFNNWLQQQIAAVEIVANLEENTHSQTSNNLLKQVEV
ncbi:peptidylprolyl isomerase [Umezakia ovalisporum]|jgi:parvulin-like peptidyl-prolyl isomerase|uniref:peptidylprolyl isomerase n=2 Tax=Umezakia ovalisporum TaxID=75695 RepID=A0AA43KED8_9CYAN|nr:peptidylprolyl isomerase [Umezakia ovalisporum]MBI1241675.1 peptidylprolyl isomerase [Nostoc sp. RI_552]MDH6055849.1 peptidylprolyl isomerase [Umezakia ovalisporum FSS-43]MDH6063195.1 peptidylprolyl isomerase [Umezakia ovalisporum FSS-62]MDH6068917.1 peptidylprolyl isomerase [Umezakia ovalisporum APH033B]MDH6070657.1 peptidylprolyl isomerase [Umezakia ovalisporum CobakiLakeA]